MFRTPLRLFNMSWSDRRLALRAAISLGLVDAALRLRGFRWVLGHAKSPAPDSARPLSTDDYRRASRYAHWIAVVARRYPVRAECLHRALTLHHWLRTEGIPSEFRVGVRLQDAELTAHAWIELEGTPIGDTRAEVAPFAPLQTRAGEGVESLVWARS